MTLKRAYGWVLGLPEGISMAILRHHWDNRAASVLDLCCGEGRPMSFIRRWAPPGVEAVGVDGFQPYLDSASGLYSRTVLADVRKGLPFEPKSFDIVMCWNAIEHLAQADAYRLIRDIERIARRQAIISIQVNTGANEEFDSNPYQEHKSVWFPSELRAMGYKVRGCGGFRSISRESQSIGIEALLPGHWRVLNSIPWLIATPLTYLAPNLAGYAIAVKSL